MNALLVASGGGHLAQLVHLSRRAGFDHADRTWVTYDTPQSATLLRGERVVHAHHPTTRNLRNAVRNARVASRLLDGLEPGIVISTGAAVAVSFLPLAAARGWSAHYVESATRTSGPSLSGRILATGSRRVHMYTQHPVWADDRWRAVGSVFDSFTVIGADPRPIRRVVVSLGTHDLYPFPRLLERLVRILPADAEVLWQTGSTPPPRGITAQPIVDGASFAAALGAADVVVAHSGTGVALSALEAGRCPVLVPRDPSHREHVDDHQLRLAEHLAVRGLALVRTVEGLEIEDLALAASRTAAVVEGPPIALNLGDRAGGHRTASPFPVLPATLEMEA